MPKLAIYVPKKEMREVERWRKKINFSKIFMRALSREIADRSRPVESSDGQVEAAAKHYRKMLSESSGPLVDFGFQVGTEQVLNCRLSPETILQLHKIEDPAAASEDEVEIIREAISEDDKRIDAFARSHGYDDQSQPHWRGPIHEGYVKGVAAAWKRVCEQMNSR